MPTDAIRCGTSDASAPAPRALAKELTFRDLVLAQVLVVVGTNSLGPAAKLGASSIVFWVLGIALYYVPLAAVVIYLSRLMPIEGGLYQWARASFGEFAGFVVAWNTWVFLIVFLSSVGLTVATGLAYALGPDAAWLAEDRAAIAAVSVAVVAGLVALAAVGLRVGKWVYNAGSVILLGVFATLVVCAAAKATWNGALALSVDLPEASLLNLAILSKITVFALSGFECIAIMAGECRDPGRTIARSVFVAAPVIASVYILGTVLLLVLVRPDEVDLVNPVAQAFGVAFGAPAGALYAAPLVILLLLARDTAQSSLVFTAGSRLPMVAGWDRLLPEWFTRLHPRFGTPANSIVFMGGVMLALGLASLVGVGRAEAFQLLLGAAGILFAATYLVLFAIPIVGKPGGVRAPVWLRAAAASGFLMTTSFVALSIFPIVDVESPLAFGAKILVVVVAANALGAGVYLLRRPAA